MATVSQALPKDGQETVLRQRLPQGCGGHHRGQGLCDCLAVGGPIKRADFASCQPPSRTRAGETQQTEGGADPTLPMGKFKDRPGAVRAWLTMAASQLRRMSEEGVILGRRNGATMCRVSGRKLVSPRATPYRSGGGRGGGTGVHLNGAGRQDHMLHTAGGGVPCGMEPRDLLARVGLGQHVKS